VWKTGGVVCGGMNSCRAAFKTYERVKTELKKTVGAGQKNRVSPEGLDHHWDCVVSGTGGGGSNPRLVSGHRTQGKAERVKQGRGDPVTRRSE